MSSLIRLSEQKSERLLNNSYIENNKNSRNNKMRAGDIFTAEVIDKSSDKIFLRAENGFEFTGDTKSIKGDIGDVLKFQVTKCGKNGIELKHLANDYETNISNMKRRLSSKNLMDLVKKNKSHPGATDSSATDSFTEEQIKTAKTVAKVKARLERNAANGNRSAIGELIKNGLSLAKISMNVLSNIVEESDKKPDISITSSELEKIKNGFNAETSQNTDEIIIALHSQGIEVTPKAFNRLQKVSDKLSALENMDDKAIVEILKHGKDITYDNLYKAMHSKANLPEPTLSSKELNELTAEINKLFSRNNIEKTEANLSAAKLLLANDIELTKDNVQKTLFLRNLDKELNSQEVLLNFAENISSGKDFNLYSETTAQSKLDILKTNENLTSIIKALPFVTSHDISTVVKAGLTLNLNNIKNTHESNSNDETSQIIETGVQFPADVITAKRQIEEIRLKLTQEAAIRLAGKNLPIDYMPLKDVVDALRNYENEIYSKNLRTIAGDKADTPANVDKMSKLYNSLKTINPLNYSSFEKIITHKTDFTIKGIHDAYDAQSTIPTSKYGDSFSKVRDQFSCFLENIDIEASNENIKAAEILSKNNLTVTTENLSQIKAIDAKITSIHNRLHPAISASMINEGLNPIEMHVDEVLEYIDNFDIDYGEKIGDSIAEHLYEMEKELSNGKEADKETRDAVFAVYKMLSLIQRDGAVALGTNLKSGRELTMGNLMEASKYYTKSKGNKALHEYSIDDGFGSLESLNMPNGQIRKTLSTAARSAALKEANMAETPKNLELTDKILNNGDTLSKDLLSQIAYNNLLLNEFARHANPDTLTKLINDKEVMDMSLGDVLDLIKQEETNTPKRLTARQDELLQELKNIARFSEQTIQALIVNEIPVTINNLTAMQSLNSNPFYIGESLDDLNLDEDELPLPETDFKEDTSPEDILAEIDENLENIKTDNASLLREINLIQNAVKVQNFVSRSKNNNHITIPVRLNNRVTNLNIYVLNEKALNENANVLMSIKTGEFGIINAYFSDGGNEAFQITADKGQAILERNCENLSERLKDSDGLYKKVSVILEHISEAQKGIEINDN